MPCPSRGLACVGIFLLPLPRGNPRACKRRIVGLRSAARFEPLPHPRQRSKASRDGSLLSLRPAGPQWRATKALSPDSILLPQAQSFDTVLVCSVVPRRLRSKNLILDLISMYCCGKVSCATEKKLLSGHHRKNRSLYLRHVQPLSYCD